MGTTKRYDCACGYHQQLDIGVGRGSGREESVRCVFDGAELAAFEQAGRDGSLTRFFWERAPGVCPACRELVAVAVLRYWRGARVCTVRKPCPACGGEVLVRDTPPGCPRCGRELREARTGFWD